MNKTKYEFIARWGARKEDPQSCGARLAVMLRALASVHPAFARWNEQGRTPAEWNRPFCSMPPQAGELAKQFARHPEQRVAGRERGYSVAAWNGRENDPHGAAFMVAAGDGNQWAPNPFANSVDVDLDARCSENADLVNAEGMCGILLAVIAGWDPDSAEVMDRKQLSCLAPGEHLPHFRAGWMSYVGPRYAPHVVPPPQVISERVPGGGLLMLATREPFDISNPVHRASADAIQRALEPIQSMVPQEHAIGQPMAGFSPS
jgi:hypothetical protein